MGGHNDYSQNRPLGSPTSTDPNTVYGAIRQIALGVLGTLTQGYLYLCTPIKSTSLEPARNSAGYTLEQVRQAVRDVHARLSRDFTNVKLIDTAGLADFLASSGAINADGTHPTSSGQQMLAEYLWARTQGADAPAPTYLYDRTFSTLTAGTIENQDGWRVRRGTGTISSSGLLVGAEWSVGTAGIQYEAASYGTGQFVEVLIANGGQLMLEYKLQVSGECDVLWFASNSLDMGYRSPGGTLSGYSPAPFGINLVSANCQGTDVWIRIGQVGSELRGWIYPVNRTCPTTPFHTKTLSGSGVEPNLGASFSSLLYLSNPSTALEFRVGTL